MMLALTVPFHQQPLGDGVRARLAKDIASPINPVQHLTVPFHQQPLGEGVRARLAKDIASPINPVQHLAASTSD